MGKWCPVHDVQPQSVKNHIRNRDLNQFVGKQPWQTNPLLVQEQPGNHPRDESTQREPREETSARRKDRIGNDIINDHHHTA